MDEINGLLSQIRGMEEDFDERLGKIGNPRELAKETSPQTTSTNGNKNFRLDIDACADNVYITRAYKDGTTIRFKDPKTLNAADKPRKQIKTELHGFTQLLGKYGELKKKNAMEAMNLEEERFDGMVAVLETAKIVEKHFKLNGELIIRKGKKFCEMTEKQN